MDKVPSAETGTTGTSGDMMSLSLDASSSQTDENTSQSEKEGSIPRRENKGERRDRQERVNENPLLNKLPLTDEGETTAMAEAFRAAARQRSKEEPEGSQE
jgi:small subunit ribosomal protein S1